MRTIRLPEPFPRGTPAERPEWGSSAWAADSCLVEWSTLEREWLGDPPGTRAARVVSLRGVLTVLAWPVLVGLVAALAWLCFA